MSEVVETTTTAQSEEIVRSQQPGELQNIQVAYRLDGKNYLKWSQLVRTVLKGKWKISHLIGTGPNQEIPVLKHGMKKILWLCHDCGILWLLRLVTHVYSWLWLRIFGTQSNRRIKKLEMRLKYMRLRWRQLLQNREVKQLRNMPINWNLCGKNLFIISW